MVDALKNWVGQSTALIVLAEKDSAYDAVMRSAGNLSDTKILLAGYLNIRDLFGYDKVVLPVKALDALVTSLG
jgi:large subunit ribosomal protein L4